MMIKPEDAQPGDIVIYGRKDAEVDSAFSISWGIVIMRTDKHTEIMFIEDTGETDFCVYSTATYMYGSSYEFERP